MSKSNKLYVLNILRQGTIRWRGRTETLRRASKKVFEGRINKETGIQILKTHWQCNKCKCWDRNMSNFEVDHIVEVGSFNGNWTDYIERLYCEQSNLQVLCVRCHATKTSKSNATLRYRRKTDVERE
jgi:hypothetical protein